MLAVATASFAVPILKLPERKPAVFAVLRHYGKLVMGKLDQNRSFLLMLRQSIS